MNRRIFAHLVALGAGSLGFAQSASGQQKASTDAAPGAKSNLKPASEPVNVHDFQQLAAQKLPKATYDYITTGSADETTVRDNLAAFERIKILPPLLTGVAKADLATTVLGTPISLPIMLAPVAAQRMYDPQGALAASRAAAAAGTLYGLSSSALSSLEEVAAASTGPKWYQLYVPKDRAIARKLIERAEKSGYKALILTADLGERKDADRRNGFTLPHDMLVKQIRDIGFNVNERMSYAELVAFNSQAYDLTLSWEFCTWVRSVTRLPLIVKGILRADDAKRAVDAGAAGIIVSNHGGRRLDGMPATIDMLPSVVEAVDGRAEVFLDSGVRRGTDVLKALALGARAVLIGRPYAWALAAQGEAGVRKVIELLREELQIAMIATGCATVGDVNRSLLQV